MFRNTSFSVTKGIPGNTGNFGGHFGVVGLGLDHEFLITAWCLWYVGSKFIKICQWSGKKTPKVAQNVPKHVFGLDFLKSDEIFEVGIKFLSWSEQAANQVNTQTPKWENKVELQHVCFCICSVSVSSKKLQLVYSSHLKWVKKTTIWKLDTLMPPISKSYMTKNDYYMKIGVIIETLMPPIFI